MLVALVLWVEFQFPPVNEYRDAGFGEVVVAAHEYLECMHRGVASLRVAVVNRMQGLCEHSLQRDEDHCGDRSQRGEFADFCATVVHRETLESRTVSGLVIGRAVGPLRFRPVPS